MARGQGGEHSRLGGQEGLLRESHINRGHNRTRSAWGRQCLQGTGREGRAHALRVSAEEDLGSARSGPSDVTSAEILCVLGLIIQRLFFIPSFPLTFSFFPAPPDPTSLPVCLLSQCIPNTDLKRSRFIFSSPPVMLWSFGKRSQHLSSNCRASCMLRLTSVDWRC